MDKGNANAFSHLARYYALGSGGLSQDRQKSNELLLKAGELGYAMAYYNLGVGYDNGHGVERDIKKAVYYFELAAMNGHITARHALGCREVEAGNVDRAVKHWKIAARAGYKDSLDAIHGMYAKKPKGDVTKDEYANTLRAYQKRREEMKSDERDKAEIYFGAGIFR